MTAALALGIVAGLGGWLVVIALRPAPTPLAQALAALDHPRTPAAVAGGRAVRLVNRLRGRRDDLEQRLALAGLTPQAWARDKLVGAVGGLTVPLLVWAALGAVGIRLGPAVGLIALGCGVGGWLLPDARLRDQVARRRKGFQYALSAYLDLVNVILAGGAGIETALVAAADAGDGWAFAELRHALHRARRVSQPLWAAFDDLGTRLGVAELRDLAASIGLAGAQGARVRHSLAVKADTLRRHQIAETEAAAEATTERMNLPTAVLLLGFLLFVVFPAVTAITTVGQPTCTPNGAAVAGGCPALPDLETRNRP